jgi:hypothetical protein
MNPVNRWVVAMLCAPILTGVFVQFPAEFFSRAWLSLLSEPAKLNAMMIFLVAAYGFRTCGLEHLTTGAICCCPWLIDAPREQQLVIYGACAFCVAQLFICKRWRLGFLPVPLYSCDVILQCYKPLFGLDVGGVHLSPLSLIQREGLGWEDLLFVALCCGVMVGVGVLVGRGDGRV